MYIFYGWISAIFSSPDAVKKRSLIKLPRLPGISSRSHFYRATIFFKFILRERNNMKIMKPDSMIPDTGISFSSSVYCLWVPGQIQKFDELKVFNEALFHN
jgi:hypothetical protein